MKFLHLWTGDELSKINFEFKWKQPATIGLRKTTPSPTCSQRTISSWMECQPRLNGKYNPALYFFFSSFENVLLWKVNKIELPVLLFLVLYQFLFQQIYIFYNFLALHLTLSEGFCHKFSFFNRFTPYPRDCLFKKNCWQNPAKAPFMYQWWTATVHIYLKVPTTDYQVFFSEHISGTAILNSISNYL